MKKHPVDIVALVGCHASGKTTLGRLASLALGWPFYEEIGKALREEVLAADPLAFADGHQPGFDQRVTALEIERDRRASWPCLVETWHPGNLAYVEARSSEILATLQKDILAVVAERSPRVLIQPLLISKETMRSRFHEPGVDQESLVDFLYPLGGCARSMAEKMGFTVAPAIQTDNLSPSEVLKLFLSYLSGVDF